MKLDIVDRITDALYSQPEYDNRMVTYESLCGKYRVDFGETQRYLLDDIQTSEFYIKWEGRSFVYVGYYDVYETSFNGSAYHKEVGEGYGKRFGEYAKLLGE
tara:strand:- start:419 stop:724 length:306 start_codon:yes stop_codon:yes gene_type:complete